MNREDLIRDGKKLLRKCLRGLLLYVLFPVVCLIFLAQPIGNQVRGCEAESFRILLTALVLVGFNWAVYFVIRGERPSLLVFSYGVLLLLAVTVIECEALAGTEGLVSILTAAAGCLLLVFLFLFSFWLAAPQRSKLAHSTAVVLWVITGLIAVFMLYRVYRDFEVRRASADTWITLMILIALIPAAFSPKILAGRRRKAARLRATGVAEGRIMQVIGETHLDRDDDLVTKYYAIVQYTVDDVSYETRADIYKLTMRWLGKKALVGKAIPVYYDPDNPAAAYANRIDRRFSDRQKEEEQEGRENAAEEENSSAADEIRS